MNITFFATGLPRGQPRARAFARKMGNKFVARVYDDASAEGWKSCIAIAAKPHLPEVPISVPVRVDLIFYMPRPKSHYRSGARSMERREDAPVWHTKKPDRDNLEKAVLDALKTIGMFQDDCIVCDGSNQKLFSNDQSTGVRIYIETI